MTEKLFTLEEVKEIARRAWSESDSQYDRNDWGYDSERDEEFSFISYDEKDFEKWFIREIGEVEIYTVKDLSNAFGAGREKIDHPDWDYVYESFDDFFAGSKRV